MVFAMCPGASRYTRNASPLRASIQASITPDPGLMNSAHSGRVAIEQIESLLTSFRVGLFFVSLIALFVGFFLIYNTVSVSIVQRKREIGTLRCLGMRRSELLRLIIAEALILAVVGAIMGCLFGWVLAQAALLAVGTGSTALPVNRYPSGFSLQ